MRAQRSSRCHGALRQTYSAATRRAATAAAFIAAALAGRAAHNAAFVERCADVNMACAGFRALFARFARLLAAHQQHRRAHQRALSLARGACNALRRSAAC